MLCERKCIITNPNVVVSDVFCIKGGIDLRLEEILQELGAAIPFDENGDLTPNGADALEKLINVVAGLNSVGAIQEKPDYVERFIDEIMRLNF